MGGLLGGILGIVDFFRGRAGQRPLLQAIAQGPMQTAPAIGPGLAPPMPMPIQPTPAYYGGRPPMPWGAPTPYGPQLRPQYPPMGGYPPYYGVPMSAPMQYGGPGSLYNLFRPPSYPFASPPMAAQSPFASPSQSYGLAPSAYGMPSPSAGALPGSMAAPTYRPPPAIAPPAGYWAPSPMGF